MFQFQAVQTGQVSVTGAATSIVAVKSDRSGITIVNTGATTVFVGENATVTTATGYPLTAGASVSFSTTGAVYGITSGGTNIVGYLQTN